MNVKVIEEEWFQDYKLPSMFIGTCFCSWKCCIEADISTEVCQNSPLSRLPTKEVSDEYIYEQFVNNPITKAVVIGGLEPMIQINEIINLIATFRLNHEECPFIIYTGYYPEEIPNPISRLQKFSNIIIKFGRYEPNQDPHYDPVLGVDLASNNQYAEVIS